MITIRVEKLSKEPGIRNSRSFGVGVYSATALYADHKGLTLLIIPKGPSNPYLWYLVHIKAPELLNNAYLDLIREFRPNITGLVLLIPWFVASQAA